MFYGLGMQELLVILAIVMLLFGGKKLPEVGRNLGKAIRGFKESEEETRKELEAAAEKDPSTGSGQRDEAKIGDSVAEGEKADEAETTREEENSGETEGEGEGKV